MLFVMLNVSEAEYCWVAYIYFDMTGSMIWLLQALSLKEQTIWPYLSRMLVFTLGIRRYFKKTVQCSDNFHTGLTWFAIFIEHVRWNKSEFSFLTLPWLFKLAEWTKGKIACKMAQKKDLNTSLYPGRAALLVCLPRVGQANEIWRARRSKNIHWKLMLIIPKLLIIFKICLFSAKIFLLLLVI